MSVYADVITWRSKAGVLCILSVTILHRVKTLTALLGKEQEVIDLRREEIDDIKVFKSFLFICVCIPA